MDYKNVTTYQIGLIQAQAYRNLQEAFRAALEPFSLTIPEWSVLGIVHDYERIAMKDLTEILRSKASHPTVLVEELRRRGLVTRVADTQDKRAKHIAITAQGEQLVGEAEPKVRASISQALAAIDRSDLRGYYAALIGLSKLK